MTCLSLLTRLITCHCSNRTMPTLPLKYRRKSISSDDADGFTLSPSSSPLLTSSPLSTTPYPPFAFGSSASPRLAFDELGLGEHDDPWGRDPSTDTDLSDDDADFAFQVPLRRIGFLTSAERGRWKYDPRPEKPGRFVFPRRAEITGAVPISTEPSHEVRMILDCIHTSTYQTTAKGRNSLPTHPEPRSCTGV
jgi:hypothetical protein